MVVSRLTLASPTDEHTGRLSDEVQLYQRTYNTLLRSSGETHLRVLEPAHRAMGSSLHPLADSDKPDLGAFIYAIRRMPDSVADGAQLVILGQEREVFEKNGISIDEWPEADAPAASRCRLMKTFAFFSLAMATRHLSLGRTSLMSPSRVRYTAWMQSVFASSFVFSFLATSSAMLLS